MSKINKYIEVDGKFYKLVKNPNGKNCDGCPFVQNERCVGGCDIDYYYQPVEIKPTKETLKKVFKLFEDIVFNEKNLTDEQLKQFHQLYNNQVIYLQKEAHRRGLEL